MSAKSPLREVAPRKAGYKSWKKKYRKMRIGFEETMQQGDDIFKEEAKAAATVKRIAVENDRLMDFLQDINNSPQIPPEKRVDVSIPTENGATPDTTTQRSDPSSLKRLDDLQRDVPHLSFETAKETNPSLLAELEKDAAETYPSHFLTPDDVDNYLHMIDASLDPETHIPTLAPMAHPSEHPPQHPLLRNPNSSTSWLRKHAPHIFLQASGGDGAEDHDDDGHTKKARGGPKGERGNAGKSRGKRASNVAPRPDKAAHAEAGDVSVDDDGEPPAIKGKRKRDDDGGYRPKGGSSARPTKKKRKSEGAAAETMSSKKSKKGTPGPVVEPVS
ncbi:uncharacterized protein J7T54_004662 [Emericellopsis cladophorae]|uniref:Uncharacterized protein n=1 Tax=Emericellopsis cladophorae TaxID=2686198 RepID=A0A9Q0BGL6_9HYPO|nr:uncharacterized protein J7T54_004662 [Emericellopsis cladophorae]KAI6784116.1 hypothetical protein J7T54_004662 [Emericellopsis cladophorae]